MPTISAQLSQNQAGLCSNRWASTAKASVPLQLLERRSTEPGASKRRRPTRGARLRVHASGQVDVVTDSAADIAYRRANDAYQAVLQSDFELIQHNLATCDSTETWNAVNELFSTERWVLYNRRESGRYNKGAEAKEAGGEAEVPCVLGHESRCQLAGLLCEGGWGSPQMGPSWVDPSHLTVAPACSGENMVLHTLEALLAPGRDTALLLTPHLPQVPQFLEARRCAFVRVAWCTPQEGLVEADALMQSLEAAYEQASQLAAERGGCCRCLLVSNPCPMTGRVADVVRVGAVVSWARRKAGLHFVADETAAAGAFTDLQVAYDGAEQHDPGRLAAARE